MGELELSIKFWGVRGSLPAPSASTLRYGGNTPCVEVQAGGQLLVLDMGSGLRALGEELAGAPVSASFLLSHYHWDHIQGLPFFAPAYDARSRLEVYGAARMGRDVRTLLAGQMVEPYFPVSLDSFRAQLGFHSVASGEPFEIGPVKVTARELNHPNGVLAYRIEHAGKALVYATDNEPDAASVKALDELARGADALIFDAMYTPAEYRGDGPGNRVGWGHSTWEDAIAACRRAGVRKLVLFHHDPRRSDGQLEEILGRAQAEFPDTLLAREGERLVL